jgi:trans-aconitate methyltransferase
VASFFLPEGYQANSVTSIDQGKSIYWNPDRIDTSVAYQSAVYRWAMDLISEGSINRICDVGCGFAKKFDLIHSKFPTFDYWGFDQASAIEYCKETYNYGTWIVANLDRPVTTGQKFDLVISSDVIEHLEDPDKLLAFIKSLMDPQSLALISTPERETLRGEKNLHSPNPAHVREWSRREFAGYLRNRGFQILEHRMLPAYDPFHSFQFTKKAIRHLLSGKTIKYSQCVLARL